MSRYIYLALITGLVGFGSMTLVACDDDKKEKKDDDKDDDKEGGEGGSAKSPGDVCSHMKSIAEKQGEEVTAEDMEDCKSGLAEMKAEMDEAGDGVWTAFSDCAVKVTNPQELRECEGKAEEAAKSSESSGGGQGTKSAPPSMDAPGAGGPPARK